MTINYVGFNLAIHVLAGYIVSTIVNIKHNFMRSNIAILHSIIIVFYKLRYDLPNGL